MSGKPCGNRALNPYRCPPGVHYAEEDSSGMSRGSMCLCRCCNDKSPHTPLFWSHQKTPRQKGTARCSVPPDEAHTPTHTSQDASPKNQSHPVQSAEVRRESSHLDIALHSIVDPRGWCGDIRMYGHIRCFVLCSDFDVGQYGIYVVLVTLETVTAAECVSSGVSRHRAC
eukprot:2594559-Pyramimonas_sp.AAC.1